MSGEARESQREARRSHRKPGTSQEKPREARRIKEKPARGGDGRQPEGSQGKAGKASRSKREGKGS